MVTSVALYPWPMCEHILYFSHFQNWEFVNLAMWTHWGLNCFFLPNPIFAIWLNFQQQNPLKPQYLPHLSSENCEINSSKFDSPESFPTTPRTTLPNSNTIWKNFNSHLFWFNSHPGRACLVLRACRSATFLDHDAKKGCEFNQKRCELKNFLQFSVLILFSFSFRKWFKNQ